MVAVLRPSGSLLSSSRAARRAHSRAERRKALSSGVRSLSGVFGELVGFSWDLLLLVGLPVLYLGAAYLVLDVPSRWLFAQERVTALALLELCAGLAVSLIGFVRVLQQAQPIQPVTPQFARRALMAGWIAAALFTFGDLAS